MNDERASKVKELIDWLQIEWSPFVTEAISTMSDADLDEFHDVCSSLSAELRAYVSYELSISTTSEVFKYQTALCLAIIGPVMEAVSPGEVERQQITGSDVESVLEYMDLRFQSGVTDRATLSPHDRSRMMRGAYLRVHVTGDLFETAATNEDLMWLGDNYLLAVSVLDQLMSRRDCTARLVQELLENPAPPLRGGSL